MQKFALIENGNILRVGSLPETWNNISNFYALNPCIPNELELLKANGWWPVEPITDGKPVVVAVNYAIEESLVREFVTTRDKTLEEINEEARIELEKDWIPVRIQRDLLLKQSDTAVVIDKWEVMSAESKSLWSNYRQALRDIPQNFSNPAEVVWPTLP